jgi:hypothetical protein
MGLIRRLAAPLAALLALVVLGEVTDVVPCRDADCGVWALVLGDGAPASDTPDAPNEACPCHASFVPLGAPPGVLVPPAGARSPHEAVADAVAAGPSDVPHPPPLG